MVTDNEQKRSLNFLKFREIEQHWQALWFKNNIYGATDNDETRSKKYILTEFPFPSGASLHLGHAFRYTITDVFARFHRLLGYNVLFPMGWDSFGLPTEERARKDGVDPRITTEKNIANMKNNLQKLGYSFDWGREFSTTDPQYYKWTQWMFAEMYKNGLVEQKEINLWWCENLATVLANEEVIENPDGSGGKVSERGEHPVEKRVMKQWVIKLSRYAEKLLDGLEINDFPEHIKHMQRNWIGKSEGTEVNWQAVQPQFSELVSTPEPIPTHTFNTDLDKALEASQTADQISFKLVIKDSQQKFIAEIKNKKQTLITASISDIDEIYDEIVGFSKELLGIEVSNLEFLFDRQFQEKDKSMVDLYFYIDTELDFRDLKLSSKFTFISSGDLSQIDTEDNKKAIIESVDKIYPVFTRKYLTPDMSKPIRERAIAVIQIEDKDEYVVFRKDVDLDMVFLPGGKLEAGETPQQAAARETLEEIGLDNLEYNKYLGSVHNFLEYEDELSHGLEHYYLFKTTREQLETRIKSELDDKNWKLDIVDLQTLKQNDWPQLNWIVENIKMNTVYDYKSYLTGVSEITNQDLHEIGVVVFERTNKGNRKLILPKSSLEAFIDLLNEKLPKGQWCAIVGMEVHFVFKFSDGFVENMTFTEARAEELATLCFEFSYKSKTTDAVSYINQLLFNTAEGWYKDEMQKRLRSKFVASLKTFTTRVDTLFAVSFLAISPEHPALEYIVTEDKRESIDNYLALVAEKSELERQQDNDKSGVFTGCFAINPLTEELVPIWVADYVLAGYGTGVVMGVAGHDARDNQFAALHKLPIRENVAFEIGPKQENEKNQNMVCIVIFNTNTQKYAYIEEDKASLPVEVTNNGNNYVESVNSLASDYLGKGNFRNLSRLGAPIFWHHSDETGNKLSRVFAYLITTDDALQNNFEDIPVDIRDETKISKLTWNAAWVIKNKIQSNQTPKGDSQFLEIFKRGVFKAVQQRIDKYNKTQEFIPKLNTEDGILFHSREFTNMECGQARTEIDIKLAKIGMGKKAINYKVRDFVFSRQRYWGEPFPFEYIEIKKDILETKYLILDFDGVLGDTWDVFVRSRESLGESKESILKNVLHYIQKPEYGTSDDTNKNHKIDEGWIVKVGNLVHKYGFSLFTDFVAELETLKNYKFAIISNGTKNYIESAIAKTNLKIDFILDASEGNYKAAKIQKILKDWKAKPENVLFIADTRADLIEARKILPSANLLAASWGYGEIADLMKEIKIENILAFPKDLHRVLLEKQNPNLELKVISDPAIFALVKQSLVDFPEIELDLSAIPPDFKDFTNRLSDKFKNGKILKVDLTKIKGKLALDLKLYEKVGSEIDLLKSSKCQLESSILDITKAQSSDFLSQILPLKVSLEKLIADLVLIPGKYTRIENKDYKIQTLPLERLPLVLPVIADYLSDASGKTALGKSDWIKIKDSKNNQIGLHEQDTMPNWAGSSWYFLRYTDPHNDKVFADSKNLNYWLPVDNYFGGSEHTTLHLLYSRFWHRFMYDQGYVQTPEPYQHRHNGGILLGTDGRKMSKSLGNFISPDEKLEEVGADALRLYFNFIGPYDATVIWQEGGLKACKRLVDTIAQLSNIVDCNNKIKNKDPELYFNYNSLLVSTKAAILDLRTNVAVAEIMSFTNILKNLESIPLDIWKGYLQTVASFAPHIAEELWYDINGYDRDDATKSIHLSRLAEADPKFLVKKLVTVAVQINGKIRAEIEVKVDLEESQVLALARESADKWLAGKVIKFQKVVPNKMVTFAVE